MAVFRKILKMLILFAVEKREKVYALFLHLANTNQAMKPNIDIVDSIKASSMTKFDGLLE